MKWMEKLPFWSTSGNSGTRQPCCNRNQHPAPDEFSEGLLHLSNSYHILAWDTQGLCGTGGGASLADRLGCGGSFQSLDTLMKSKSGLLLPILKKVSETHLRSTLGNVFFQTGIAVSVSDKSKRMFSNKVYHKKNARCTVIMTNHGNIIKLFLQKGVSFHAYNE